MPVVSFGSVHVAIKRSLLPDAAVPDFATFDLSAVTFEIPTFSIDDLSNIGLFDSIMLAVDGLDTFLGGLQDVMDGEVFGLKIPFIGDKLSAAGDALYETCENCHTRYLRPTPAPK